MLVIILNLLYPNFWCLDLLILLCIVCTCLYQEFLSHMHVGHLLLWCAKGWKNEHIQLVGRGLKSIEKSQTLVWPATVGISLTNSLFSATNNSPPQEMIICMYICIQVTIYSTSITNYLICATNFRDRQSNIPFKYSIIWPLGKHIYSLDSWLPGS